MKVVRAQVTIPSDSGMPADNLMNTFHFHSPTAVVINTGALNQIVTMLDNFYTGFEGRMPDTLVSSPASVEFFDLTDPEPRPPVHSNTFGFTPGAGLTALPSEVCVCVSWSAGDLAGINPRSRRGRNFIGPLATNSIEVVSGRVQFTAAALTAWSTAANDFADAITATDGYTLAIYSPTLHAATTLENATSVVIGGHIDNAPDTQRRRGTLATTRTTF